MMTNRNKKRKESEKEEEEEEEGVFEIGTSAGDVFI